MNVHSLWSKPITKIKNAFHCKQRLLSQGRWVLQAVCLPAQRHLILDLCRSRRGLRAQVASLTLTWVSTKSTNACDNSVWRRNNQHVILILLSNQVELVNKSTFTAFRSGEGWDGSQRAERDCTTTTAAKSATTTGRNHCPTNHKETHQELRQDNWKLQGTARYVYCYQIFYLFFHWNQFVHLLILIYLLNAKSWLPNQT